MPEHPPNANLPIPVTLLPIVAVLILSQPLNAPMPMFITLSGIVISVKAQLLNAYSLISVTLSGMVMLVKLLQPLNALSPIFVTGRPSISFGIFIFTASAVQAVIVIALFSFLVYLK